MGRVGISSTLDFVNLNKFFDTSEGLYSRICDSIFVKWL